MSKILDPRMLETSIKADGILYFLESGHFLFRYNKDNTWQSKFVTIQDVAASFSNVETDTGWIEPGIIRTGRCSRGDWFIYSVPAQRKELTFDVNGEISSLVLPIPITILIGIGHAYYLFACKDRNPGQNTKIYHAPFPNVYSNSRICWGQNRQPKVHHMHAKKVWNLFFDTPFNSHLVEGKSKQSPANINQQLQSLAGARRYPLDDLVEVGGDLSYVLHRLLERNWRN